MTVYDKPYKTYEERIDHLINDYNLVITDRDFAEYALKTISYYDLINGYKDIFMTNDKYDGTTTIEFLYQFYLYDKEFQNLIFTKIILIENYFKNVLANQLSKDFGVHQDNYLDHANFNYASTTVDVQRTLSKIRRAYTGPSPEPPTKYYLDNHNHIPPWILFKNVTFSLSINLFVALKTDQKIAVAEALLPSETVTVPQRINLLTSGLNLIRHFRNTTAHNLKFVTYKGTPQDTLPRSVLRDLLPQTIITKKMTENGYKPNDLFAAILFIYLLLGPRLQLQFCAELSSVGKSMDGNIEELSKKYWEITGLPEDFDKKLDVLFDSAAKVKL